MIFLPTKPSRSTSPASRLALNLDSRAYAKRLVGTPSGEGTPRGEGTPCGDAISVCRLGTRGWGGGGGHGAVAVTIKAGWEWAGHTPGQYVRLGIAVDGIHHWRAYSLTSEPGREDGCISITPKLLEGGKVSPFLNGRLRPGALVGLGGVEGVFVLPDPLPRKLLFVSGGSGVTPIMSMLRSLVARGQIEDVVHVHCAHATEDVIFGGEMQAIDSRYPGYRLQLRLTGSHGRVTPDDIGDLCPDWETREAF